MWCWCHHSNQRLCFFLRGVGVASMHGDLGIGASQTGALKALGLQRSCRVQWQGRSGSRSGTQWSRTRHWWLHVVGRRHHCFLRFAFKNNLLYKCFSTPLLRHSSYFHFHLASSESLVPLVLSPSLVRSCCL